MAHLIFTCSIEKKLVGKGSETPTDGGISRKGGDTTTVSGLSDQEGDTAGPAGRKRQPGHGSMRAKSPVVGSARKPDEIEF